MNNNLKEIELPIKMDAIYESGGKNTIRIWGATYRGLPCYCVEHKPTGHIEIIDHDDAVLSSILAKITRAGCLVADRNGAGHMLKFHRSGAEKGISLRLYVFAQYNGIEADKMRRAEISLYDRSLLDFDITDLRSGNLYNASEFCPVKNGWELSVLAVGGVENSIIRIRTEKYDAVEYLDYSAELYQILGTSSMCCPSYNRLSKRIAVGVRTGVGEPITMNLSRFAGLFGRCFHEYRPLDAPIKSFLHDLPRLTTEMKKQYDHINACAFNDCMANLFPMDAKANQRKSNGFGRFRCAGVKVIAVANGRGDILIEYQMPDNAVAYYKCKNAEDFLDWQKAFLGTDKLTENTRIIDVKNQRWIWLRDIFKKRIARATLEEKEREMLSWCADRDRVLAMEKIGTVEFRRYTPSGARYLGPVVVPDDLNTSVAQFVGKKNALLQQRLPKGTVIVVTKLGSADNGTVSV